MDVSRVIRFSLKSYKAFSRFAKDIVNWCEAELRDVDKKVH